MNHLPYEDDKHQWLFIASSSVVSTEEHYRYRAEVCAGCGKFVVFGHKNGQHFKFSFDLPTDELVQAAGQYARYLQEAEAARQA